MSRAKTAADDEKVSVGETESSSAVESEVQTAEKSEAADGAEKPDGTEDSSATSEAENVSSVQDVKENLAAEKKYGIVRYFQMNPIENKTLERTLKKMYGRESHTVGEWKSVIANFLNQKV